MEDFTLSEEQVMLRDGARQFLEEQCSTDRVREVMETDRGYDEDLWKKLSEQGWPAMHIPEEFGGAGFTFAETAILQQEMGRVLAPVPYLSSAILAAEAVLAAGSAEQKGARLPELAAGSKIATVAIAEPGSGWDEAGVAAVATPSGEGFHLSGTKAYVTAGHVADWLVVAARLDGAVRLFLVAGDDIAASKVVTLDSTRPVSTVDLAGAPGELLEASSWPTVERIYQVGAVALAAEQVGGLERVLEMAVEYAKERKQFGRAIGSFQAVKHMCADMLVALESARSAAAYAALAIATGSDDARTAAALAKSFCSEAYFTAAGDNIQVHGGIGFTWEHDAHLYFKRAKSTELLFGSPAFHRERLAAEVGL
ncbi:MAG: acyl-CoA/acyl-ACP dehydrogenase [Acidimicrobiales bacterium]|nr:acyl-CoA/acyl-ACP dehydrogenase [Acidimicrobiales bacterium]